MSLFWVCNPNCSVGSYDDVFFSCLPILFFCKTNNCMSRTNMLLLFLFFCAIPFSILISQELLLFLQAPLSPNSAYLFGLFLISPSKLASTPVLLEWLEIWPVFTFSSCGPTSPSWAMMMTPLWCPAISCPDLWDGLECFSASSLGLLPLALRGIWEGKSDRVIWLHEVLQWLPVAFSLRWTSNCKSGNGQVIVNLQIWRMLCGQWQEGFLGASWHLNICCWLV